MPRRSARRSATPSRTRVSPSRSSSRSRNKVRKSTPSSFSTSSKSSNNDIIKDPMNILKEKGYQLSPSIPLSMILAALIRITLSLFVTTMVPVLLPTLFNKLYMVVLDLALLLFIIQIDGYRYETRIFFIDNLLCLFLHFMQGKLYHPQDKSVLAQTSLARVRSLVANRSISKFNAATKEDDEEAKPGEGYLSLETINIGNCDIYVLRPKNCAKTTLLPVILYMHGGGHVIGTGKDATNMFSSSVGSLGCDWLEKQKHNFIICSVEYRLAPEHPYPAAANDCIEALNYICQHSTQLGIDSSNISVMGLSAGGNLACVVSHHAAAKNISLKSTIALIPEVKINCANATDWSFLEYGRLSCLSFETMIWFWQCYCPDPVLAQEPNASPINNTNENFAKLSKLIIVTNNCDPLRDSGIEYAKKTKENGGEVTHLMYRGSHTFGLICDTEMQTVLWNELEDTIFGRIEN